MVVNELATIWMSSTAIAIATHMAVKPIQMRTVWDIGGENLGGSVAGPSVQPLHRRVHNPLPQGRNERQQNAAGVAQGELGCCDFVAKTLVGRERARVMMRVAAHVEDQGVRQHVAGVPAMHRTEWLASVLVASAQQAVMGDIVEEFKNDDRDRTLSGEKRCAAPAGKHEHSGKNNARNRSVGRNRLRQTGSFCVA